MPKNTRNEVRLPESVREGLKRVTDKILSLSVSDFVSNGLYAPSTYLLKKNGKLIRPTLVLMGAHAIGNDPMEFVDLAVASELLHTSSLIHDDIIDGDLTRRGSKTVHAKYGEKIALLAGDALISKAVSMATRYGEDALRSMTKASMDMCAGELLDYNFQKTGKVPTVRQCLDINTLKTASLIATCCNIVAVNRNERHSKEMYLFGRDLGIAFQIRDDIIDYKSWSRKGGKGVPIPNMVSSIVHARGIGGHLAVLEAMKLNERYVRSAFMRLGNNKRTELLKDYARSIIMRD